jgi:hypothetical protein
MTHSTAQSGSHFLRTARRPMALLGLSFASAYFLNNTVTFWYFMSWLPRSFMERLITSIDWVFSLISPIEVFAQEERLEFLTAWCFSAIGIFALYLSLVAIKAIFRAQSSNEP